MEDETPPFEEEDEGESAAGCPAPLGGALVPAAQTWSETWAADPRHPVSLWLRNQTRSATVIGYRQAASLFAAWLAAHPGPDGPRPDILRATFNDLLDYRDHLATAPLPGGETRRSGTVRSHMERLAAFYAFLVKRGYLRLSPADGLKVDQADDGRPKLAWEREQIYAFWHAIDQEIRHATEGGYEAMRVRALRDKAMFAVLFRNGLRVSEAAGANIGHLVIQQGEPILRLVEDDDREHVKGGHARIAVLMPKTFKAIQEYLDARGLSASPGADPLPADWRSQPLFLRTRDSGRPNKAGVQKKIAAGDDGRISRWGVRQRMRYYGEAAGIPEWLCHPHAARRTFATHLIQANVPLPRIADDTGHRSLDMLLVYWKHNQQVINAASREIDY